MGLLSKMTKSAPAKKPTDDVLLLHSMFLMANIDGDVDDAESAHLDAFIHTLPEFQDKDIGELVSQCHRLVSKFTTIKESVAALKGIESPTIKKKAFMLAVDIAMSSGDVDEAEDELITAMQRLFELDDAFCESVINLMNIKYAT